MFSFLRPTSKLTPEEEADEVLKFAYYKRRIFQTSAYTDSGNYELLYSRLREMLRGFLEKHRATLIKEEARRHIDEEPDIFLELDHEEWRIRRQLNIEQCESAVLLALAMYSFLGPVTVAERKVAQNRFFANRAIEYLIEIRSYGPAMLAKALILTYGFQEYLPPNVEAANGAFKAYGLSDWSIKDDISALVKLETLANARSTAPRHPSQDWKSHGELQVLLRDYHPLNRNG